MNKHFEDSRYYIARAVETAKKGITEELAPVERRLKEMRGSEPEPKPGRTERLRNRTEALRNRVSTDVAEAIDTARARLTSDRT